MKNLIVLFGAVFFFASAAWAEEIDTCTTFEDEPPNVDINMLCSKEAQHSAEMGLPEANERTVLSLDDLYELGWSLRLLHRFQNADGNYVYRVYLVRDN